MIDEKKRDEAWERNKAYLETKGEKKETLRDLLPICKKCSEFKGLKEHDFQGCRGEACMELWLSNEYQEWFNSYY